MPGVPLLRARDVWPRTNAVYCHPVADEEWPADPEIVVDAHERYAYSFSQQRARTTKQALPRGDYAVVADGKIVASVERKSAADLLSSMMSGRLRYDMADLASLPRAAVIVEDQYSTILSSKFVSAKDAADGLAELQVRYPVGTDRVRTDSKARRGVDISISCSRDDMDLQRH